MFIDARSLPGGSSLEADVCIVGGGAAGITLAREFEGSAFKVILIESGNTEYEEKTQALYKGTIIGRQYFDPTIHRLRFFGGTTNHWGGLCPFLDPLDFEGHEGIPGTSWPISYNEMLPWYTRAQDVCELAHRGKEFEDWGIDKHKLIEPFNGPTFISQVLQLSPPTRFGKVYYDIISKSSNVRSYLNANALEFEIDENNRFIKNLILGVLPDQKHVVKAQIYILAAGGMENARLLLLSNRNNVSLGNSKDLVGRYFMVHLEYTGGLIIPANRYSSTSFFPGDTGWLYDNNNTLRRYVTYSRISDEVRKKNKLANLRMRFNRIILSSVSGIEALERLRYFKGSRSEFLSDLQKVIADLSGIANYARRKTLYGAGSPLDGILVQCTAEQIPNWSSRIKLGDDLDAFGQRRICVDWHLSSADRESMFESHRILGAEVGRVGLGRFCSSLSNGVDSWPPDMYGDEHNMGTTRMHSDPKYGVVDQNCKIHGIENLYIAGSSVFPTSGSANPTFTLVALSIRLADFVKKQFMN